MQLRWCRSVYHLFDETFVLIYWIGLWHLFSHTGLLEKVWFDWLCVFFGAIGLLFIKAVEPVEVQQTIAAVQRTAAPAIRVQDNSKSARKTQSKV